MELLLVLCCIFGCLLIIFSKIERYLREESIKKVLVNLSLLYFLLTEKHWNGEDYDNSKETFLGFILFEQILELGKMINMGVEDIAKMSKESLIVAEKNGGEDNGR